MTTSSSTIGWRSRPLDQRPVIVGREAARAQGHRLVEAHALADHRGLADHDARAVIDEEAAADLRAGMDVDARQRMGDLGDVPRQEARRGRAAHAPADSG